MCPLSTSISSPPLPTTCHQFILLSSLSSVCFYDFWDVFPDESCKVVFPLHSVTTIQPPSVKFRVYLDRKSVV